MAEIKKRWYVLRVIGGKEKKVKEYIENEVASLGLQDYVSQVFIPTEKIYQVRNGKKISKERNFFPGYVMIEAALVGEIPHMLRDITNVIGFLGETKGGDPVPYPPSDGESRIENGNLAAKRRRSAEKIGKHGLSRQKRILPASGTLRRPAPNLAGIFPQK